MNDVMHGNSDFFRGEHMSCRCVSLVDFVVWVSLFAGRPGLSTLHLFFGGGSWGRASKQLFLVILVSLKSLM